MKNYLETFFRAAARRRTLHDLRRLDAHLLRDIGLTHADLALMLRGEVR